MFFVYFCFEFVLCLPLLFLLFSTEMLKNHLCMRTAVSWLWIIVHFAWKNYKIIPGGSHVNHVKCITLSTEHAEYIKENIDIWFCEQCNLSLLPFNHIENEIEFICCVKDWPNRNKMSLSYFSDKLSQPFELNGNYHSNLSDTDPDPHFYNSNYYLEPHINERIANRVSITKSLFSLSQVNIRSKRKIWVTWKPTWNY